MANYEKVNWTTGEKVREGYVIIDGVTYQTVQPEYTGETPVNVANLNHMDEGIYETSQRIQEDITTDGEGVRCGYKIDGNDVYVKRINFGNLPNTTSKSVATGIDFSTHTLIKIEGIAKYQGNNIALPLPFSHPTNLGFNIMVNIDASNNLVVTTGTDRSGNKGYFNIYYI